MTDHTGEEPSRPDRPERVDLFLSGGGYRAALAALGTVFFLATEQRWSDVRRIVSVSGGSIVNAHLALARPTQAQVPGEIKTLFDTMTSRRGSLRHLTAPALLVALPTIICWIALVWWGAETSRTVTDAWLSALLVWAVAIIAALLVAAVAWPFFARLALHELIRSTVGTARLGDLRDADWRTEHIFVATDLSASGAIFFITNGLGARVGSQIRGVIDAATVPFEKVVRASTALPGLLPPTRFTIVDDNSPPERRKPIALWLADGGVSGNLGVQYDSTISPDNIASWEWTAQSSLLARTPQADQRYNCAHRQKAWMCLRCSRQNVVVDASGVPPKASRVVDFLIGLPILGGQVAQIRSMQVLYHSALTDDQSVVGDDLVGVTRADLAVYRAVRKSRPIPPTDESTTMMLRVGGQLADIESYLRFPERLPPLLRACVAARESAASVPTGLTSLAPPVAARVVASGLLNTVINHYGTQDIEKADTMMRALGELLGPQAALQTWWDGILASTRTDAQTR